MWQYCWAHAVYHLIRWFPYNNRLKARIVVLIFTFALLVPQIIVLARPHTSRFCGAHLLEMLIVSMVLTFCMIGFSFLFSLMEPVPWEVKLAFHIFGILAFVIGVLLTVFTGHAENCKTSTEALYYYSIAATVISLSAILFYLVLVPFWVVNRVCRNSVLDRRGRDGLCYEPVKCCTCLWHI